nr:uncharacterized protein LOC117221237 [Megalopta genalis]
MKFLLLLAFVVVAAVDEYDSSNDTLYLADSLSPMFNISVTESLECIKEWDITKANLKYMVNSIDLEDNEITDKESLRKATCAMVCCAQKAAYMIGPEIQMEKILDVYLADIPMEVSAAIRESTMFCKGQLATHNDECLDSYVFFKCLIRTCRDKFRRL